MYLMNEPFQLLDKIGVSGVAVVSIVVSIVVSTGEL